MVRGWPRQMQWTDFRAIANPGPHELVALNGHPIVARVSLSIYFQPSSSPQVADGGRYKFQTVNVELRFDRLEYVPSRIPAGQQPYYLAHEQGHVDLMGLFAREMEVNLLALRSANSLELLNQARGIVDQAVQDARMYAINTPSMDCIYDRETNHGMNHGAQARWLTRIASNMARRTAPDFHVQIS